MSKILKIVAFNNEKKNFISNFFSLATLQGLNYFLPLLTLPYLVRVLGPEKFGLLAFATAVMSYFIIITDYGFNFTATREISLNLENHEKLNEIFSSVMIIKMFLFVFSAFILIGLVVFVPKFAQNSSMYLISYGVVLGQVMFPVWFFQGIEKMLYITLVNVLSKIIFTVSIFIFVESSSDYLLVPLLTSVGMIIAGVYSLLIIFLKFNIKFKLPPFQIIIHYFKSGSHLFYTSILSNLLTSSGTIILSFMTNNTIVGYYSAVEKLFRAFVGLFAPITQALYPISCRKSNDTSGQISYIKKLLLIIGTISILIGGGVAIYSNEIIVLVYGLKFEPYSYILAVMMIWLVFGVINNIIGIQFLSASKKDKFYTISFIIAGLLTVLLNLILIPIYQINGILYAMVFGEIVLLVSMLHFILRFKL